MESSSCPNPIEVRFHFVLRGSFYPLHKGHANLFQIAKQYISGLPWPENVNVSFGSFYLSPMSTKSLARKHGCVIDHQDVVERLNSSVQDLKIAELVILPHRNLHGVPSTDIISELRKQVEGAGSNESVDKLVQISGVDSKVQAIVRDHFNCPNSKSRKKQNKKKGSNNCPQMLGDLRLVLVVDGRGVPLENARVVESFPHVADIRNWTGPMEPTDLLPKSSTMQRYIDAALYYPGQDYDELSARFDLRWLVDTGVDLGRGRQGLVRLMMIGGHAPAAVKIVRLAKRNRFAEEAEVWRHMAVTSPGTIPRLYCAQTVGEFGVIVTDVGVPLTEIFTALKPSSESNHTPTTRNGYEEFFGLFKTVNDFNASDLPVTAWNAEGEDLDEIKWRLFESLQTTVLPGLERANVIHRDLKLENWLYMPHSRRMVVCDFGVSAIASGEATRRGPRGALKYYPIRAVDQPDYYQPWCDAYFASLSLVEIVTEEKIFPDMGTAEVIEARREGIEPVISEKLRLSFERPISWIKEMWEVELSER